MDTKHTCFRIVCSVVVMHQTVNVQRVAECVRDARGQAVYCPVQRIAYPGGCGVHADLEGGSHFHGRCG